ncbi:MAG: BrxA/BrxB family bacilliredoxin [Flavobacteriales bacterium]|nr:BrxA/BrxB family bacilliredoxin [Flavobacteriales bacterium]
MYPPELVMPMKHDLTSVGVEELLTPEDVDNAIKSEGTTLLVINSVCGCAAGNCRPAVKQAIKHDKKPTRITTAFAGVDREAVAQARSHMAPYPPSSPSIALFKDGNLVHFIERHHIEGRSPEMIADNLTGAFDEHC